MKRIHQMTKYYGFHHDATESELTPALQQQEARNSKPLVIWRLTDGKPGHENQSLGLCHALAGIVDVRMFDIPVRDRLPAWLHWLTGRFPAGTGLPSPDLIVGAGHRTHPALLAARRASGGRAVVIMKPSLPPGLFDLCIIPEHDGVTGANVFVTRGVMNTITPCRSGLAAQQPGAEAAPTAQSYQDSAREDRPQTLILLGGTSRHYQWREAAVLEQVAAIVRQHPGERFILSDSRRTPDGFMGKLVDLGLPNLKLVPWRETGAGWVARQLGQSRAVWVSEDSVSMVYEALTSGATVGLITLEQGNAGRISRGIEKLINEGWVTTFKSWKAAGGFIGSPGKFDEAARCAEWMVEQWLPEN